MATSVIWMVCKSSALAIAERRWMNIFISSEENELAFEEEFMDFLATMDVLK